MKGDIYLVLEILNKPCICYTACKGKLLHVKSLLFLVPPQSLFLTQRACVRRMFGLLQPWQTGSLSLSGEIGLSPGYPAPSPQKGKV